MKATGIVRKIDELGRIVIPKELRNIYNIGSNSPMEIYVNKDEIILQKFLPINESKEDFASYTKSLAQLLDASVFLSNEDVIVSSHGDKEIINGETKEQMRALKPISNENIIIAPIIIEGITLGTITAISDKKHLTKEHKKMVDTIAHFISNRLEF